MWTRIQMHIWHCEKDKSPIEHLYALGFEHNINNLKGENMWCQTSYHSPPMCEHSCTYWQLCWWINPKLGKIFLNIFCNVHNRIIMLYIEMSYIMFLITHKQFIKWFFKLKWVPKSSIWFIPFAYCSLVNLCFMRMFVDKNKPLSLNQVHFRLGGSTLKLAKTIICLQSHLKIWVFHKNTRK